jgi:hypothetical protein
MRQRSIKEGKPETNKQLNQFESWLKSAYKFHKKANPNAKFVLLEEGQYLSDLFDYPVDVSDPIGIHDPSYQFQHEVLSKVFGPLYSRK